MPAFDVDFVASEAVKGILREDKVVTISEGFNIAIYALGILPTYIKHYVLSLGTAKRKRFEK